MPNSWAATVGGLFAGLPSGSATRRTIGTSGRRTRVSSTLSVVRLTVSSNAYFSGASSA
jgi:hypothetical protein